MTTVSIQTFIEAGMHFGHQTRRRHPKMEPYIHTSHSGVHIIDLRKTWDGMKEAHDYVFELAAQGKTFLMVGTKPQAREVISQEAQRAGCFYINERWLGGLLTNFNTIRQSTGKLKQLDSQRDELGQYPGMLKKESLRLEKKRVKLEKALGGIRDMHRLPHVLILIDCRRQHIAVEEANKLGLPLVALVDSNCNPDPITCVVPGNDDSQRSIALFCQVMANAIIEGNNLHQSRLKQTPKKKAKPTKTILERVDAEEEQKTPVVLSKMPEAKAKPVEAEKPAKAEEVVAEAPQEAKAEEAKEAKPQEANKPQEETPQV